MDETKEPISSLTSNEIKTIPTRRPTAEEFRQYAGVQPVDKEGKRPLGTCIPKPSPQEVEKAKKIPPEIRRLPQENTLVQYYWLNPEETTHYPPLPLETSPETTVLGLIDLGKTINQVVDKWLSQKEGRKRLAEILELSSLPQKVVLALEKVNQLLTLEELDLPLRTSLETLKSFYEQDPLPLLRITQEKRNASEDQAKKFLNTPKGKRKETYLQKAQRILLGEKARRATRLYHSLVKAKAKEEIPSSLSEETLRLASIVNYVRLLEVLEKAGIDFPKTKTEVQKLLANIPPHQERSSELTKEEEEWLENLNQLLAPIANAIAEEFPHDSVFLLSQVLEHQQALCGGKAMMLTAIYRSLGLDARFTYVLVRTESKSKGEHAICQINLPNGIILSIDANWDTFNQPFLAGLNFYYIFAGLLLPTEETLSIQKVKEFLDELSQNKNISIVIKGGQFLKYKVIGNAHRLTTQSPEAFIYDKHHLATIFLCSFPHLFIGTEYGKNEDEVKKSAARLYQEAIKDNPNFAGAMYNLAWLIINHPSLFASTPEEEINQLEKAKKLLEKHNQIEKNPERIKKAQDLIRKIEEEIKKRKNT